jgi:CTP synthase (UTP-ammonia lyase)
MIEIGIFGDFDATEYAHQATNIGLHHAAEALETDVRVNWLSTPSLLATDAASALVRQDALFAAPGSPYHSFEGMLSGITYARTHQRPFLGTCGGFQYALIEYARNVLGLRGAGTEENGPAEDALIAPVACPVSGRRPGAPKLSGSNSISLRPGSCLAAIYRGTKAQEQEQYFCNFEVNTKYRPRLETAGMLFAAEGGRGEPRAFELPGHPFFIATLYQPQRSSKPRHPHPLLKAYLEAAMSRTERASGICNAFADERSR